VTWQRFTVELTSSASADTLFSLLSDAPRWPSWFRAARKVEWCPPRASDEQRVRRVWIGPIGVREAVLEEQAPRHHAYAIRSTIPVTDHRADVWFHEGGGSTSITWSSSFRAKVPGTGHLLAVALRLGVRQLGRSLIAEAEGQPAAPRV
jgi:hypothetical protein